MKINISEEIINKALCTYINKGTRYIQTATIEKSEDDTVTLECTFNISESCYLSPASGHFNAVEAIMCFNQMLYVALLGGIQHQLYSFYEHISPDIFNQNRRKVYILDIENIHFKKQVDNKSFYGKLILKKKKIIKNQIYIDCSFGYSNDFEYQNIKGTVKAFIPSLKEN